MKSEDFIELVSQFDEAIKGVHARAGQLSKDTHKDFSEELLDIDIHAQYIIDRLALFVGMAKIYEDKNS